MNKAPSPKPKAPPQRARTEAEKRSALEIGGQVAAEYLNAYDKRSNRGAAIARPEATADERYGGLKAYVDVGGVAFERAIIDLEWLLQDDRWKSVGAGFDDVNKFLASLRLGELRASIEQRKRIVTRIKELQPEASNRQVARTIGINERTVSRDTAANAAVDDENINKISSRNDCGAANAGTDVVGAKIPAAIERAFEFAIGPPPAPVAPLAPDYVTPKFDALIEELAQLITRPVASFERTAHTSNKLKTVADFILAVCVQLQKRLKAGG